MGSDQPASLHKGRQYALALAGILLAAWGIFEVVRSEPEPEATSPSQAGMDTAAAQTEGRASMKTPVRSVPSAPMSVPLRTALQVTGLLTAEQKEVLQAQERQWLQRHGYPEEEQWKLLAGMDRERLERDYLNGSDAAGTMLGYKLGLYGCDGDAIEQGAVTLMDITARGSSFAPQMLAEVQLARYPHGDVMAMISPQVALMHSYLLGDYGAAAALERALPSNPGRMEIKVILGVALTQWEEIQENRRNAGLPPLVNQPRPNAGYEPSYDFDAAAPVDGVCYEASKP